MTKVLKMMITFLAFTTLALPTVVGQEKEQAKEEDKATSDIRRYTAAAATSPIKVDGVLDEPAWADAVKIYLDYEWYPGDNTRPPVETDCMVTFDKKNFYVAFHAYDPNPKDIRGHLMDRDQVRGFVQDDFVGVNLDTFNDERQALQFRVNPMNVQMDGTFNDFDGTEDFAWDAIWDSKAKITDDGYVVEIAIPFKQMRYANTTEPQTWGLEAFRNYPRGNRHRISSRYTDRAKHCVLCLENKVDGIVGPRPGINLEITPTVTGSRTDARTSFDGPLISGDEETDFGGDVRWGVTPNFTLSATVNPDFSNIEADAAQLDVNTRFALFFDEKRPFFLEGADDFETPLRVIFSRSVADPTGGLKLTGKQGKSTVGLYLTQDDVNNILVAGNQRSGVYTIPGQVEAGVLRYRQDVGKGSAIGVTYADRSGDDYSNRMASLDAFIRFNPSDSMRVQYARTDTDYPDLVAQLGQDVDGIQGNGMHVSFLHRTRDWLWQAAYEDLDPDFRADSGFIDRVDLRVLTATGVYRKWGKRGTWYRLLQFGFTGGAVEDHDGLETDRNFQVFGIVNGPKQSVMDLTIAQNKEYYGGVTYDLQVNELILEMKPNGNVHLKTTIQQGDDIDYNNFRSADKFFIRPSLQLRLGKHINWKLDYIFQTLDVDGGELSEVQLTQSQFVYQFNSRMFLRSILQYQVLDQNPDVVSYSVNSQVKTLFNQILFSYKINPHTVAFLGYRDDQQGFTNEPVHYGLTETDRTIFVKFGYAFLR